MPQSNLSLDNINSVASSTVPSHELPPTHKDYFRIFESDIYPPQPRGNLIPTISAQSNFDPKHLLTVQLALEASSAGSKLSKAELVKITKKGELDNSHGDAVVKSMSLNDEFVTKMLDLAIDGSTGIRDNRAQKIILQEFSKEVKTVMRSGEEVHENYIENMITISLENLARERQAELSKQAQEAVRNQSYATSDNKNGPISKFLQEG